MKKKKYQTEFLKPNKIILLAIFFSLLFLWCMTMLLWSKNLERLDQPIIYSNINAEYIN